MSLTQKLIEINSKLDYYVVEPCSKVLGEDGQYIVGRGEEVVGYAVKNAETGVVEATTLMLPTAIFQADYLDKALTSLFEKDALAVPEVAGDDVVLN
jgi:hypothetical protein